MYWVREGLQGPLRDPDAIGRVRYSTLCKAINDRDLTTLPLFIEPFARAGGLMKT